MTTFLLPVSYAVIQLVLLIAVGFLIRKLGRWTGEFFSSLSRFVVKVALPLYFVVRVSRTDLGSVASLLAMLIAAAVIAAIGLGAGALLFRMLPYRSSDRRAGIAMGGFGNSGFMPLTLAEVLPVSVPAVATMFGTDLPAVLIAAYLFVFSPLLWSVGHYIITKPGDSDQTLRVRDMISPPLIGIVIGLVIQLTGFVAVLENPSLPFFHIFASIDRLGSVTIPLAMINLGALIAGVKLPKGRLRHLGGMAISVIAIRFLLLPGVFYASYFLFLRDMAIAPAVLFVLFLETHIPPAGNFSLMAGQAGVNEDHTAASLLASYAAYVVLMPFFLVLFLTVVSA